MLTNKELEVIADFKEWTAAMKRGDIQAMREIEQRWNVESATGVKRRAGQANAAKRWTKPQAKAGETMATIIHMDAVNNTPSRKEVKERYYADWKDRIRAAKAW